jgi:hypothetical protein
MKATLRNLEHPGIRRGRLNGRSRLTERDVIEIRQYVILGERQVDIARRFGVHQTQVSRIVLHKAWSHVK